MKKNIFLLIYIMLIVLDMYIQNLYYQFGIIAIILFIRQKVNNNKNNNKNREKQNDKNDYHLNKIIKY